MRCGSICGKSAGNLRKLCGNPVRMAPLHIAVLARIIEHLQPTGPRLARLADYSHTLTVVMTSQCGVLLNLLIIQARSPLWFICNRYGIMYSGVLPSPAKFSGYDWRYKDVTPSQDGRTDPDKKTKSIVTEYKVFYLAKTRNTKISVHHHNFPVWLSHPPSKISKNDSNFDSQSRHP